MLSAMTEDTLSYETEPRGLMVGFGVFVVLIALVPSTIVFVQYVSWSAGDPPLHTDPLSIVPGLLLALWGAWLATHHVRVSVERSDRSLTWVSYAFGLRLRTVHWHATEIARIRVASNGGVKPSGYSASVSGPLGTRTLLGYFHGSSPPRQIRDTARALGVELETERR